MNSIQKEEKIHCEKKVKKERAIEREKRSYDGITEEKTKREEKNKWIHGKRAEEEEEAEGGGIVNQAW